MLDSLNYRMKMAEKKVSKCKKYININYLILQKKMRLWSNAIACLPSMHKVRIKSPALHNIHKVSHSHEKQKTKYKVPQRRK